MRKYSCPACEGTGNKGKPQVGVVPSRDKCPSCEGSGKNPEWSRAMIHANSLVWYLERELKKALAVRARIQRGLGPEDIDPLG